MLPLDHCDLLADLIACWLRRGQIQWMFQSDDSYEPYPADINILIEKAYRDRKPRATWEEQEGRFEVDFVRMVEEKDGSAGSVVKVKRNSSGLY